MQWYLTQIKDLQNVRITHLKLNCDSEEIKILDRILGLQCKKRNLLFSHHFIQIMPWRVNSLTPHILSAVEHIVKNLNPQMRHTDLIDIRETHRKAHINVFHVLHHRIHLSADVTGRFLNF